jgi:cell division septum initiation protein DivIVA
MSRIEEIIAELEDYFENCKFQPLSNTKIIVNKDEVDEIIDALKNSTPDEIKRYSRMVSNKDAILADAQKKADALIEQTKARAQEMVTEHEIMQQAYAQANEVVTIASNQAQEILDKATDDANDIRTSAITYTDQLLANLASIVSNAIAVNNENYTNLIASLQENLNLVNANRGELHEQDQAAQPDQSQSASADAAADGISVIASGDEE